MKVVIAYKYRNCGFIKNNEINTENKSTRGILNSVEHEYYHRCGKNTFGIFEIVSLEKCPADDEYI